MSIQQGRKRPGPAGKSCLTCRARTRPVCETCRKGKFDCLGYDQPETSDAGLGHCIQVIRLPDTTPSPGSDEIEVDVEETSGGVTRRSKLQRSEQVLASGILDSNDSPALPRTDTSTSTCFTTVPPTIDHSENQLPQLPGDSTLIKHISRQSKRSVLPTGTQAPMSTSTIYYDFRLFRNPGLIPPQMRDMFNFIILSYEQLVNTSFFRPEYGQVIRVRDSMSWRLQTSPTSFWCMFLAAKVFEGMLDHPQTRAIKFAKYYDWIERYEKRLDSMPWDGLTPTQIQDRLGDRLDISLFKLRTTNTINTYRLLRSQVPTFLNIVFSDPAFWSDARNSSKVSLAYVLASTRFELAHFALLDMMCSLAYGLPQVVDYDTSMCPPNGSVHPVEWIHGCPIELQIILVEINQMCAWGGVGPRPDWQLVERKLLDWKPALQYVSGEEPWKPVARLAVRESWRHALLIYLYMAVCGVTSDDPRVSYSVKQVFQITSTVKEKPQPITRLHFSTQYLIAGAYTPNEKERAVSREELLISIKTGSWLLSGSHFVPVLDHLWHGAAANGRPIRWSDYIHSRQVALPIPL